MFSRREWQAPDRPVSQREEHKIPLPRKIQMKKRNVRNSSARRTWNICGRHAKNAPSPDTVASVHFNLKRFVAYHPCKQNLPGSLPTQIKEKRIMTDYTTKFIYKENTGGTSRHSLCDWGHGFCGRFEGEKLWLLRNPIIFLSLLAVHYICIRQMVYVGDRGIYANMLLKNLSREKCTPEIQNKNLYSVFLYRCWFFAASIFFRGNVESSYSKINSFAPCYIFSKCWWLNL